MSTMKGIDGGKKIGRQNRGRAVSLDPADASDHVKTGLRVPAQDSQGKSIRIIFRVPTPMGRQVEILKGKAGLGFETSTDVQRAAFYEGMRILSDHAGDPSLSNMQAIIDSWVTTCRIEDEYLRFTSTIDHITGTINKMMAMNAPEKAKELARKLFKDIRGMDDGFWRSRYESEFTQRFGYLVKEERGKK